MLAARLAAATGSVLGCPAHLAAVATTKLQFDARCTICNLQARHSKGACIPTWAYDTARAIVIH